MRKVPLQRARVFIVSVLLALLPVLAMAQTEQGRGGPPPVSQPMVSEGMLAVSLASALGVRSTTDAIEAESSLGDVGVAPHNGWIADYPVTPDIAAELQQAVMAAADQSQLPMTRDEASKRYADTLASMGLTVRPYTSGESAMNNPVSCENYPNPATVISSYSSDGPPIVTYYCPPPDYYYLYSWVPYPFWWSDFWFPGFFVLKDFHRHVFVHRHPVLFTNHFNDVKRHRMFRIDPVDRLHGKTFAGIGAPRTGTFISTGIPRSSHTIFNAPRSGNIPGGQRQGVTPSQSGPSSAPAMRGGGASGSGGMHGGGSGMNPGGGGGMRR